LKRAEFDRMMGPWRARVQMLLARAVVRRVDDAPGIQAHQLAALEGELIEGAERMQDYGFTSVPHPGAEAVVAFPGGLRSHGLVVSVGDRRYRLKGLQAGEVALYDDVGQQVVLGREGIRVTSALKIEIDAPEVTATASTRFKVVTPHFLVESDLVELGGEGGKLIGRHDDPVVAGKVVATTTKVKST
jgi:phage baseplate assembly protein V